LRNNLTIEIFIYVFLNNKIASSFNLVSELSGLAKEFAGYRTPLNITKETQVV